IDGKRVLGNPREIREVKNAYEAYEEILTLTPYDESHFFKMKKFQQYIYR
ncbi:TPA: Fic family protein, partial [Streptococcus pyogenes]